MNETEMLEHINTSMAIPFILIRVARPNGFSRAGLRW